MTERDDQQMHRDCGGVLAALDRIRRQIDARVYPGRPWAPPRRRLRLILPVAAAAAAAAAILIAAVGLPERAVPPVGEDEATVEAPAAAEPMAAPSVFTLDVPTDLDPAGAGRVAMVMPKLSMPALGELAPSASLNWNVPTVSMPSLELGKELRP